MYGYVAVIDKYKHKQLLIVVILRSLILGVRLSLNTRILTVVRSVNRSNRVTFGGRQFMRLNRLTKRTWARVIYMDYIPPFGWYYER